MVKSSPQLSGLTYWVSYSSHVIGQILIADDSSLTGSTYIFRHKQLQASHIKHLSSHTDEVIRRARNRFTKGSADSTPANSPRLEPHPFAGSPYNPGMFSPGAMGRVHLVNHSGAEIRDALHVARNDHMSGIDALVSGMYLDSYFDLDLKDFSRTGRSKVKI